MINLFSGRTPHLLAASMLWQSLVKPEDHVIDATCGNGHDTLQLAKFVPRGLVWAFDIQDAAIRTTGKRLAEAKLLDRVHLRQISHEKFPQEIPLASIRLIVYNLGYLPGGDKLKTTQVATTLASLHKALSLLMPGGAVSITLYPGHEEGGKEKEALLEFSENLASDFWTSCHLQWTNRLKAPSLLLIWKKP